MSKLKTAQKNSPRKTEGYSDCCMFTMLEWGHSRNDFSEDVNDFIDDDHMGFEESFPSSQ